MVRQSHSVPAESASVDVKPDVSAEHMTDGPRSFSKPGSKKANLKIWLGED
jgi:hypothetical protein